MNHPGAFTDRSRHGYLVDFLKGCHPFLWKLGGSGDENDRAFRSEYGWETGDGIGVTRPAATPLFYRVAAARLTLADAIEASG